MNICAISHESIAFSIKVFMRVINKQINVHVCDSYNLLEATIEQYVYNVFVLDVDFLSEDETNKLLRFIRNHTNHKYSWLILIGEPHHDFLYYYKNFHCYEHILKPFEEHELNKQLLNLLEYKLVKNQSLLNHHFIYYKRGRCYKLLINQILYAEIYYKNCTIYTANKAYDIGRMPLSQLENQLPKHFIQCHRSYLVNQNYVSDLILEEEGLCLILEGCDYHIPVGRIYKEHIINMFESKAFNQILG